MTDYKKLLKVEEEEAELLWSLASQSILDYTNRTKLLDTMDPLVFELCKHYIAEEKRQGVSSKSEGAISVSYSDMSSSDGIPPLIKTRLNRYKLLHIAKK